MPARLIPKLAISAALVVLTWGVFGQTLGHEFVNYDDNTFVSDNRNVNQGLTLRGTIRAFTHIEADNWHPLTIISHMLDCQLFGLKPGWHHFTNVLLHSIAVVLLFVVLYRITSALWRSAAVATVFAIHPLHVESVAWVAERKDVLSGVFFMLTLGAYGYYALRPTVSRYFGLLILFGLGLMSKPMLVTMPLVFLLLDYWPLNRFARLKCTRLLVEKIPLLLLSAGLSVATLVAQSEGEAQLQQLPFTWRVTNAFEAYLVYIWQMIWPAKLALIYPHPGKLPLWQIGASAILLVAITAGVLALGKRRGYLVTGWFWYVIMLLPVIGLIQVGEQGHADRYTYLPSIGLCIAAVWAVADASAELRHRRQILSAAAMVIIATLASQAWRQTAYWRNGEQLWAHTLSVTEKNDPAHMGLGEFLLQHHRTEEAVSEFRAVLSRHPHNPDANFQLASALAEKGELDLAVGYYRKVLAAGSDTVTAHCALADVLVRQSRFDDAASEYGRALIIDSTNSRAETSLANVLLENGKIPEAIEHYRNVVRRQPSSALGHYNLAVGLHRGGQLSEAIVHYREALAIKPDYPDADYFLGQALLQNGQPAEAKSHLEPR